MKNIRTIDQIEKRKEAYKASERGKRNSAKMQASIQAQIDEREANRRRMALRG